MYIYTLICTHKADINWCNLGLEHAGLSKSTMLRRCISGCKYIVWLHSVKQKGGIKIRCHKFWSVCAYVLPIWLLFNHNSSKDSNLLTTSMPATLLWLHLRFLSDFKLDRGVREVILLWDMSKYSRLLKFDIASTSGNIYFEWEKRVLKWNERKLHQWVCWMRQWAWSGWWR